MIIVITGASGAIGAALVQILHTRGDSLLLCGRDATKLEALNVAMDGAHQTLVTDPATADGVALLQAKAAEVGVTDVLATVLDRP